MNSLPFTYTLIRSKRKTLSIQIKSGGDIFVRVPKRLNDQQILQFVSEKSAWVQKHLVNMQSKALQNQIPKGYVMFLGEQYKIEYSEEIKSIQIDQNQLIIPAKFKENLSTKLTQWYKKQAKTYITERVMNLANQYDFRFKSIRITSAKTRWGSCTSSNKINFSYRLILLNPAAIDYVIIHELCHTKQHNHSQRFWDLVEAFCPGYKEQERYLKSVSTEVNLT